MEIDVLLERFDGERPVIVDAKYKTSPASANLQQMVTYCWMTGARQAVLVFPAGVLVDHRPFQYRAVDGSTVTVHLVAARVRGLVTQACAQGRGASVAGMGFGSRKFSRGLQL
jgi:5-methylcytosine-specific restriction endonuclease McrBC regulatory subunit McrC